MSEMDAKAKMKEASIAVRILRADGHVEDLGVVSYWHKNPLRRLWWRLRHRR